MHALCARVVGATVASIVSLLAPVATPAASDNAYREPWEPTWALVEPTHTTRLAWDAARTPAENGERLRAVIQTLQPGTRLDVERGIWSVESYFDITLSGTPTRPIWIVAEEGAVITRSNAGQNALNVGANGRCEYVCLRGFEIRGGSAGVRLYDCRNVWIDRCEIHHTAEAGVTANTVDTAFLYLTRNEVHHTSGSGEGFYLGGNDSSVVMRSSVVAENHVHDTGGSQGDGIELKEGSFGNWIVRNLVHDTNYPCLLAYGTDGNPRNVIEDNVLYGSNTAVLQVQGEALVRNNLVMDGAVGFESHDHQGDVRDLEFVHNTVINNARAASLYDWAGRPGMVLANNAFYSGASEALVVGSTAGVLVRGNVSFGTVIGVSSGFRAGNGLGDFTAVSWDAAWRMAQPAAGSALLGAADPALATAVDAGGAARSDSPAAGCFERDSFGLHYGEGLAGYQGKAPAIGVNGPPLLGNTSFAVRVLDARPHSAAVLLVGRERTALPGYGGVLWTKATHSWHAVTNASGRTSRPLPIPSQPTLVGNVLNTQWAVLDPSGPSGVAFTNGLSLRIEP